MYFMCYNDFRGMFCHSICYLLCIVKRSLKNNLKKLLCFESFYKKMQQRFMNEIINRQRRNYSNLFLEELELYYIYVLQSAYAYIELIA